MMRLCASPVRSCNFSQHQGDQHQGDNIGQPFVCYSLHLSGYPVTNPALARSLAERNRMMGAALGGEWTEQKWQQLAAVPVQPCIVPNALAKAVTGRWLPSYHVKRVQTGSYYDKVCPAGAHIIVGSVSPSAGRDPWSAREETTTLED
ncbi:hypothetical protein CCMA1212_001090 [Trichoderma ghanense]|uniref:Uncharacterized protein n=1 Tax=Trichoderma ghanense TaxID=65468 RepID=A0ABY2HIX8_9HYPO